MRWRPMRRKTPSALRASTEAWHISGRSRLLLQRASVRGRVLAVAGVGRRGADGSEEQRDLRGCEQIEARRRLPQQDERGEQEEEITQDRDQRVEQAIDDIHVEAAAD